MVNAGNTDDDEDTGDQLDSVVVIKRIEACASWVELAELLLEHEPTNWETKFLGDLIRRQQEYVTFKQRCLLARMVGELFLDHLPRRPPRDEQDG